MQRLEFSEIASILGQSDYTIRSLADRFALFLPATRVEGDRFFRPEAIDIFRLIIQQLDVGVRDDYVEFMLSKRYPVSEVTVLAVSGAIDRDAFAAFDAPVDRAPARVHRANDTWGTVRASTGAAAAGAPFQPSDGESNDEWHRIPERRPGGSADSGFKASTVEPRVDTGAAPQHSPVDPTEALKRRIDHLERRLKELEVHPAPSPSSTGRDALPGDDDGYAPAGAGSDPTTTQVRSFDSLPNRSTSWLGGSSRR